MNAETFSIISSIVSILLGFIAIALSFAFYYFGRESEKNVASLLTQIKTQADSLEKLSGTWMTRLIKHVTTPKPNVSEETYTNLISAISKNSQLVPSSFQEQHHSSDSEEIEESDLHMLYIALYYYTAQTNFWSQLGLPTIEEFDESDENHMLIKNTIDMSFKDFEGISNIIEDCDINKLKETPNAELLSETKENWSASVRDSAFVFKNIKDNP